MRIQWKFRKLNFTLALKLIMLSASKQFRVIIFNQSLAMQTFNNAAFKTDAV